MSNTENHRLQAFVHSPEMDVPCLAVMLNPRDTIGEIKRSVFLEKRGESLESSYFSVHGKPLRDSSTIASCKIRPLSVLNLRIRAPGGGGDGGATGAESRDCYLNMYASKKPDKVDPNETRLSKWTTCALSSEPLKPPCVVDRLGNMFNKEALVEGLLEKKLPKAFHHIRGLKDMIPIHLSIIPGLEYSDHDVVGGTRYQCPITGLEFNGKYRFLSLKRCGHVQSAKSLKEVKASACLVCHVSFTEDDKVVINGSEEEVSLMRKKMEEERSAKLKERRLKKLKYDVMDGERDENPLQKSSQLTSVNSTKRFKAVDRAPANADKQVYASIFTSSSSSKFKETYSCRSLPLGRN